MLVTTSQGLGSKQIKSYYLISLDKKDPSQKGQSSREQKPSGPAQSLKQLYDDLPEKPSFLQAPCKFPLFNNNAIHDVFFDVVSEPLLREISTRTVYIYCNSKDNHKQSGRCTGCYQAIKDCLNSFSKCCKSHACWCCCGEDEDDSRSECSIPIEQVVVNEFSLNYSQNILSENDQNMNFAEKSYEVAVRFYIYSIIFNDKYASNIRHFLNYYDREKEFKLKRHEFEMALLTLIDLFQESYKEPSKKKPDISYNLPDPSLDDDSSFEYHDCILFFADTLVKYIYTTRLQPIFENNTDTDTKLHEFFMESMPVFLSCLQHMLSKSLAFDKENHSDAALKLIFKALLKYGLTFFLLNILILCTKPYYLCNQRNQRKKRENQGKKHLNLILSLNLLF